MGTDTAQHKEHTILHKQYTTNNTHSTAQHTTPLVATVLLTNHGRPKSGPERTVSLVSHQCLVDLHHSPLVDVFRCRLVPRLEVVRNDGRSPAGHAGNPTGRHDRQRRQGGRVVIVIVVVIAVLVLHQEPLYDFVGSEPGDRTGNVPHECQERSLVQGGQAPRFVDLGGAIHHAGVFSSGSSSSGSSSSSSVAGGGLNLQQALDPFRGCHDDDHWQGRQSSRYHYFRNRQRSLQ